MFLEKTQQQSFSSSKPSLHTPNTPHSKNALRKLPLTWGIKPTAEGRELGDIFSALEKQVGTTQPFRRDHRLHGDTDLLSCFSHAHTYQPLILGHEVDKFFPFKLPSASFPETSTYHLTTLISEQGMIRRGARAGTNNCSE